MFCSTCNSNSCNCTTYTIPSVSTTCTSAIGAAGPAGLQGGVILFNNPLSLTADGTAAFYTWTADLADMDTDGDKLIITTYWSRAGNYTGNQRGQLDIAPGGTDIVGEAGPIATSGSMGVVAQGVRSGKLTMELTRLTYSTLHIWFTRDMTYSAVFSPPTGIYVLPHCYHDGRIDDFTGNPLYSTKPHSVANMNTTALKIVFRYFGYSTTGQITFDRLTVKSIKQI